MISVTRLNGTRLYLNAEQIQMVEGTPDTVITLNGGVKIIVRDSPQAVVEKFIQYQRLVKNPQLKIEVGE
ncbi:MAG: flagellar FlbD family protein [Chloroflexi bacterium]|jgi:flagellar protein FlbD|nr:flagellar FlbD family protein [Chloroflexota bacterium]